ncbi:hypothetical protein GGP80_000416 [Salinibacter ruber]|nr:hypothetical protein [Salinibacter ruber]
MSAFDRQIQVQKYQIGPGTRVFCPGSIFWRFIFWTFVFWTFVFREPKDVFRFLCGVRHQKIVSNLRFPQHLAGETNIGRVVLN